MGEIFVHPAWGKFREPFRKDKVSQHEICNETEETVAFKIKSSDDDIRVTPLYGIIKPKTKYGITVRCMREKAPLKDRTDKVKVCLKALDPTDLEKFSRCAKSEAKELLVSFFEDEKQVHGFVEVFILTKSTNVVSAQSKTRSVDQLSRSRVKFDYKDE